jgi:hypothetical protein
MQGRSTLIAAALVLGWAGHAAAQARRPIAIVPLVGYTLPGSKWTDNDTITLEPGGGIFVGLSAELALGKALSFQAEATRTLGLTQSLEFSAPAFFADVLETDITTTQLIVTAVFRPQGRLPSGQPRGVYVEAGGGYTLFEVSGGFSPPGESGEFDFGSSSLTVTGGVGVSIPAGRRFALQLFARGHYLLSEYESNALDDWNASDPPSNVQGETGVWLQFGAGLRVGR